MGTLRCCGRREKDPSAFQASPQKGEKGNEGTNELLRVLTRENKGIEKILTQK